MRVLDDEDGDGVVDRDGDNAKSAGDGVDGDGVNDGDGDNVDNAKSAGSRFCQQIMGDLKVGLLCRFGYE